MSDLGCVVMVQPIGLNDAVDLKNERERVKDFGQVWKSRVAIRGYKRLNGFSFSFQSEITLEPLRKGLLIWISCICRLLFFFLLMNMVRVLLCSL